MTKKKDILIRFQTERDWVNIERILNVEHLFKNIVLIFKENLYDW